MVNNPTIITLLAIWPELSNITGEQWEILRPQLSTLLEAFDATTDSSQQAQLCVEIQQVLETVPEALDLFDLRFTQVDLLKEAQEKKGTVSSRIRRIIGHMSPSARTFTRYTNISCPRCVWIQARRISVVVRLNLHPSAESDVQAELRVSSDPVLVQIDAPGFKLLGPAAQKIAIVPEADSTPLVFDLAPSLIGDTTILFNFIQGGNPVGTACVRVKITEEEVPIANQSYEGRPLRATEGVDPPDFILYITYQDLQDAKALRFRLLQNGDVLGREFGPIPLKNTPEEYARDIYQRLTNLARQIHPTVHALSGAAYPISSQAIEEKLQEEGQNMWQELIPYELREHYKREREKWRDKSLLIISDEPYIPWELLWPYGSWGEEGPLCLHMNLSRWLRRNLQGDATYEPEPFLCLRDLAVIIPPDSGLLAAQRERSFMRALMLQYGLRDVSPEEPSYAAVKRLLQQGGYSWLHVAAHGNFYAENPDGESAIWLMDQQPLTPRSIVGEVEHYLREQRPTFVFNACELGRQGWAITGLGGWAGRLIGAGAGLFLAPLWVVNDGPALKFSITVYQALLERKTAAEAVRQGRLTARRLGNPTWLAYSLYAHPNARAVQ
jgi:hypothetical protein